MDMQDKQRILLDLQNCLQELIHSLKNLNDIQDSYMGDTKLWAWGLTYEKWAELIKPYSRDFSRELHNYLSSFGSLCFHYFRVKNLIFKTKKSFENEFENKRKNNYTEVSKFVRELRNYSQKHTLPMAGAGMDYIFNVKDKKDKIVLKSPLSLKTHDLLEDKEVKKAYKKLKVKMESHIGELEIMPYINQAHQEITTFYYWLSKRIREL